MPEIIIYAIYFGIAILISGIMVLALGSGIAISSRLGHRVLTWVFPLIGAAIILKTIASKRNVDLYISNPAFSFGQDSGITVWVLRAFMWSILVICGGYLISIAFSHHQHKRFATPLFVSFIGYFICSSLLNAAFGSVPYFDYKFLYMPLVVTAFYIGQEVSVGRLIGFAKATAAISILLGLMAAVFYPSIAIQSNYYAGLIPWLHIRLWGLDSHANTLGPLVVMFLLLELAYPYRRRLVHYGFLIAGGLTLLLSQSKTAWAAFIVAMSAFILLHLASNIFADLRKRSIKLLTAGVVSVLILLVVLAGFLLFSDIDSRVGNYFASSEGAKISSLTGRHVIWNITLAEWQNNILFGYGPKLWGPEFSAQYHLLGIASNAHNQFVNVLGTSGLFGFISLIIYLGLVIRYTVLVWPVAGSLPVVLLVALIIRSIAEAPFGLINVLSNDFCFHLLLLGILFCASHQLASGELNIVDGK